MFNTKGDETMRKQDACVNCGHTGDHDDNNNFCKVCGRSAYVKVCRRCERPTGANEKTYCVACETTPVFGEFTFPQLDEAFDTVKNPKNWKMRGTGIIDADKLEVTSAAVVFFAGGGLEVVKRDGDQLVVTFPGYYAIIGS